MNQKALNTRQWALYKYLKKQQDWVKLDTVMAETGLFKDYRVLKSDIRQLRLSGVLQKPIMTNTAKGIKLATKKEYKNYSGSRWKAIIEMVKLQKLQDKKAGLDGQFRLVFGSENDMINSFAEVEA